jgi:GT2 family glycosyltransferase
MPVPRERPSVSVVIPHLNQHEAALRCLASVKAQDYPAERVEIILADNGSKGGLERIAQAHPDVRIVREMEPGPGMARNAGVAVAGGEILAFVDADCRAHPGWLSAAVDALESPGATGVVGGDVRIDLADPAHMTGMEAYESVFAYRQKMYIAKMNFSGTGNLAMRRTVFDAVGPFAGIRVAEDRDWGRRAIARGYKTRYVPGMIVYHPARTGVAEMAIKWQRQTAHDLVDHRAKGRPAFLWLGKAAALIGIVPLHAAKILMSDRVAGLGAKLRGILTLAQVRALRAREMVVQWADPAHEGAAGWNRN